MKKQQIRSLGLMLIMGLFVLQVTYFSPKKKEEANVTRDVPLVEEKVNKGVLHPDRAIPQNLVYLENENMIIGFSSEQGHIAEVKLKGHNNQKGELLTLVEAAHAQMHVVFVGPNGETIDTSELDFTPLRKETATGTEITFTAYVEGDTSRWVKQIFFLSKGGYEVSYRLEKSAMLQNGGDKAMLVWSQQLQNQETVFDQNQTKALVKYYDTARNLYELKEEKAKAKEETPESLLHWVGIHMAHFVIGLTADEPFGVNRVVVQLPDKDDQFKTADTLKEVSVTAQIPDQATFYFGPNAYYDLKGFAKGFEKNHYLGPRLFRGVNTHFILPVARYLHKYIANYIWVLLILILLLALLQFFFVYQSYITNLKTKAAKPITDRINGQNPKDPKNTMVIMQIHSQIGAGPFKSVLYGFIQIPVFIAMINFTRYNLEFRHLSFLWINDLSAYDNLLSLPFHIPMLGSHISLIGLLSTVLFFVISKLKQPTPTNNHDSSTKVLTYVMPFIFFLFFNSTPSSWWVYRFFANIVELIQFGILKLTVREEKITQEVFKRASEAYQNLQTGANTQGRAMKRMQKKK